RSRETESKVSGEGWAFDHAATSSNMGRPMRRATTRAASEAERSRAMASAENRRNTSSESFESGMALSGRPASACAARRVPCRQQHHQGRAERRLRLNLFGNPSTQEQVKSRHEGKVKLIGEQSVHLSLRVHTEQRNAHV